MPAGTNRCSAPLPLMSRLGGDGSSRISGGMVSRPGGVTLVGSGVLPAETSSAQSTFVFGCPAES